MANTYHDQLTGSDLHENKINATTGTELTPASQATYDNRWANKAATAAALAAKADDAAVLHPSGTETVSGAKTFNPGAFQDKGNLVFDAAAYGAISDVIVLTDAAITNGTTTLTSATAAFTTADVGKAVLVVGAGSSGHALSTTIASVASSGQVTLATTAGTTVAGAMLYYGTDNGIAINLAITAAIGAKGRVRLPSGGLLVKTPIAKDADNVDLFGAGRGKTTLYCGVGYGATLISIGNTTGPSVRENIRVEGLTIDMCQNQAWGLSAPWCRNVWFKDLRVCNPGVGMWSMIYVGLFSNMSASWDASGIYFDKVEIDYGGVNNAWEAITLGYAKDIGFNRVRVLNKPGIAGVLSYNSEFITFDDCYFYKAMLQASGRGPITLNGTTFDRSWLKIYAGDNVTMSGGGFIGDPADYGTNQSAGVAFQGNYFATSAPEVPFYITSFPYTWQCKNIVFNGVNFKNCNAYGISAATTTVNTTTFLSAHDITLNACTVSGAYWDGVKLAAYYLTITANRVYNNGQSSVSSTRQNFFLAAAHGTFIGNQSYDDQGTPTALRDVVFTNEYVATYLPAQTWDVSFNSLGVSGAVSYYNGGFTSTKPAEITVNTSGTGDVTGPGSATDKAVARFSGATGKTLQNSPATIGDAGNIATTIASGGNAVALTLTQNDTTNNPRGMNVTNAGTGIGFNLAQNGNGQAMVIADAGTSASLTINKNNTGGALTITRNQANGVSAMVRFNQSNVSDPQDAVQIAHAGTGSALLVNTSDLSVKGGKTGIGVVTPNSPLQVAGPIATALSTKTTAYTVTASDSVILADATSAAFQVTLPSPSGITGRQYTIKKIDASGNAVTVASASGNIDGAATKVLSSQWSYLSVVSSGSDWVIVSQGGTIT